jgi:HTH-type transcriptional regulator/antitoxin HigA
MITNERQYAISKKQLKEFEKAVETGKRSASRDGVHPRIHEAMLEGLDSQAEDLREQIERYEKLKSGKIRSRRLDAITELPVALIEGRIVSRISQKELAKRLGLPEQQIQRYEASRYAGVSIDRIGEVVRALGLKLKGVTYGPGAADPARRSSDERPTAKRTSGSARSTAKRSSRSGRSTAERSTAAKRSPATRASGSGRSTVKPSAAKRSSSSGRSTMKRSSGSARSKRSAG